MSSPSRVWESGFLFRLVRLARTSSKSRWLRGIEEMAVSTLQMRLLNVPSSLDNFLLNFYSHTSRTDDLSGLIIAALLSAGWLLTSCSSFTSPVTTGGFCSQLRCWPSNWRSWYVYFSSMGMTWLIRNRVRTIFLSGLGLMVTADGVKREVQGVSSFSSVESDSSSARCSWWAGYSLTVVRLSVTNSSSIRKLFNTRARGCFSSRFDLSDSLIGVSRFMKSSMLPFSLEMACKLRFESIMLQPIISSMPLITSLCKGWETCSDFYSVDLSFSSSDRSCACPNRKPSWAEFYTDSRLK